MNGGETDARKAERDAADRRYNEALTIVDRALPRVPDPPATAASSAAPPSPLRDRLAILSAAPRMARGWRARAAEFVWSVVSPALERQQAFNAAAAEELDRLQSANLDTARAVDAASAAWRDHLEAFYAFDSRLVQYLQQITPFIDTRVRVLEQALEELRMAAAAAQRTAVAAKRELERLGPSTTESPSGRRPAIAASAASGAALAAAYVGFEDLFRGAPEDIKARQREYADRFAGASDVLDIGCGRGEFLELLVERGISASGVDANPEMAEVCRDRGLDVRYGDALEHLQTLPDGSLGGLLAAQVVEHLQPDYLVRLIETAHAKLRPGALIVLETINVACWVAYFESYIRDITHVRPLHPDTLKFLVVAAGFEQVDVHFRSPVGEEARLQSVATEKLSAPLLDVVRIVNANVDRLNERMFTCLDYAVIGSKGPE
jgi:O-antigen chain-terminating methyltransferase